MYFVLLNKDFNDEIIVKITNNYVIMIEDTWFIVNSRDMMPFSVVTVFSTIVANKIKQQR